LEYGGIAMNAARLAVMGGAAGSVAIMLRVGHRNDSTIPFILLVLFTGWVLSPFVALLLVERVWKHRPPLTQKTLHRLMLIVTLGSLAIYGYVAWSPPRPKPASGFLLVPLGSWLLMGTVLVIAALRSSRRPGGRGSVPRR
jgi:uncharacterized protein YneF (UPF0154 family)